MSDYKVDIGTPTLTERSVCGLVARAVLVQDQLVKPESGYRTDVLWTKIVTFGLVRRNYHSWTFHDFCAMVDKFGNMASFGKIAQALLGYSNDELMEGCNIRWLKPETLREMAVNICKRCDSEEVYVVFDVNKSEFGVRSLKVVSPCDEIKKYLNKAVVAEKKFMWYPAAIATKDRWYKKYPCIKNEDDAMSSIFSSTARPLSLIYKGE